MLSDGFLSLARWLPVTCRAMPTRTRSWRFTSRWTPLPDDLSSSRHCHFIQRDRRSLPITTLGTKREGQRRAEPGRAVAGSARRQPVAARSHAAARGQRGQHTTPVICETTRSGAPGRPGWLQFAVAACQRAPRVRASFGPWRPSRRRRRPRVRRKAGPLRAPVCRLFIYTDGHVGRGKRVCRPTTAKCAAREKETRCPAGPRGRAAAHRHRVLVAEVSGSQ